MKVSVIIPVYNAEKYLEECILSALHQTYPDIEVIAINDGSSDGSSAILQKYEPHIRIVTKSRGGVASARNAGIQLASGEWIKLLDNDDVLYPHAIDTLLKEASQLNKEDKILYGNVDYIDAQGNIIGELLEPNHNELPPFESNVILLDHNMGIPSTWLIHKSVFVHTGLFDESTQHDDYEYHLRACLLHNCRFHLVDQKIVKYRFHDQQFTWQVMRKYEAQDKIAGRILNMLEQSQRNQYIQALDQYRKNRSSFEKIAHRFKPILKFLPVTMEIKLRTLYLKIIEKNKKKQRT